MKNARFIGLIVLLLLGCSKEPDLINSTFYYYYNTIIVREIEKTCPECEYSESYVENLRIEAKKCEKNFTYLELEDCEEDLDRIEDRWNDCEDEVDEVEDRLDDCEDRLCDLNSSEC